MIDSGLAIIGQEGSYKIYHQLPFPVVGCPTKDLDESIGLICNVRTRKYYTHAFAVSRYILRVSL